MKSIFKLGFLAIVFILSLSACDFFSGSKNVEPTDSIQKDSILADSIQKAENLIDSTKIKADSTVQSN